MYFIAKIHLSRFLLALNRYWRAQLVKTGKFRKL
jgi:hypothetical protein